MHSTHQNEPKVVCYRPWGVRKIKGMESFKQQYWKSVESAEGYTVSAILFFQSGPLVSLSVEPHRHSWKDLVGLI